MVAKNILILFLKPAVLAAIVLLSACGPGCASATRKHLDAGQLPDLVPVLQALFGQCRDLRGNRHPGQAALAVHRVDEGRGVFALVLVLTLALAAVLTIYVNQPVAALTATPNPGGTGQAITFDASGSHHGHPDRFIVEYQWDFGDGHTTTVATVADPYRIEATHAYAGTLNKPFTATLTVWDGAGLKGSDTYPLVIRANTLSTRADIAVDEGLWWLFNNNHNDSRYHTVNGSPFVV